MRSRRQNGMANKMASSAAAEYPETDRQTVVMNAPFWLQGAVRPLILEERKTDALLHNAKHYY
jgi:hypothetical protein